VVGWWDFLLTWFKVIFMEGNVILAAPVSQAERIVVLDILRGLAILGILLMNIPAFAFPGVVQDDPTVLNEFGTINYYLWFGVDWIFSGTQRAMFSMLFGAGIILFVGRQLKRAEGLQPADYFFRRQLWLMAFSLVDVYILLWNGDILLDYACYGMMLFAIRDWTPRALIIGAGVCVLLMLARENRELYLLKSMIKKGEAVAALDTTTVKLTALQKEHLADMTEFKERMSHEAKIKRMNEVGEKVRSGYAESYKFRTENYFHNLVGYLYLELWDVVIFFMLGMAFFKLGILTGTAPMKVYAWMCVVGLSLGLALSYWRVQLKIDYHFNWFEYAKHVPFSFSELTRTPRALGLLGLIMLLHKSGWFNGFLAIFRPVGQMAFTNYLGQSLICGILFNGYGFALFGKLQRYEIYLVVAAVWAFQIIFCNIWMHFFLYGPLEWAWRSLTYWKRQPFVRRQTQSAVDVVNA
jgi:uncharacterized protein